MMDIDESHPALVLTGQNRVVSDAIETVRARPVFRSRRSDKSDRAGGAIDAINTASIRPKLHQHDIATTKIAATDAPVTVKEDARAFSLIKTVDAMRAFTRR